LNRGVTGASSHVRFELQGRAENVALVRSALSALGQATGLDAELLTDLKTAISEACNNVVIHAYGDEVGPMTVTLEVTDASVRAIVRDYGSGITHIGSTPGHMGLGLGVMSALSTRFEVNTLHDGTEVRMVFSRDDRDAVQQLDADEKWLEQLPLALSGEAVLWLQPVVLLAPVFGRVLRAYAAASSFTADRTDELVHVGEALSEFASAAGDGSPVGVAVVATPRRLGLVSGPYPNVAEPDGRSASQHDLGALVEDFSLTPLDGQTTLSFTLRDHHGVRG
jgi:serine/threonine-protein kinase RsbW